MSARRGCKVQNNSSRWTKRQWISCPRKPTLEWFITIHGSSHHGHNFQLPLAEHHGEHYQDMSPMTAFDRKHFLQKERDPHPKNLCKWEEYSLYTPTFRYWPAHPTRIHGCPEEHLKWDPQIGNLNSQSLLGEQIKEFPHFIVNGFNPPSFHYTETDHMLRAWILWDCNSISCLKISQQVFWMMRWPLQNSQ